MQLWSELESGILIKPDLSIGQCRGHGMVHIVYRKYDVDKIYL